MQTQSKMVLCQVQFTLSANYIPADAWFSTVLYMQIQGDRQSTLTAERYARPQLCLC